MRVGKTASGFAYRFDEQTANDMIFFETLEEVESENTSLPRKMAGIGKIAELLLGREQKAALYAHLAARNDGRVPPTVLEETLTEIMQGAEETKN